MMRPAFPIHYLAACIVNGIGVLGLPTLGIRIIDTGLSDAWLFPVMALLMIGWGSSIGGVEAILLNYTRIHLRWVGVVRLFAGFLAGGLVCYIGYLLAYSTLGFVISGQTPHITASILLSVFGLVGLGCWGVGLILPLVALRPYLICT